MGTAKPPAERCIYCQSTGPRTKEHIIPHSIKGGEVMDGLFVWPEATCKSCQRAFMDYEGQVVETLFPGVAFHHGISTRKEPRQITIKVYRGAQLEDITVASGEEPLVQCVYDLGTPGILRDGDPSQNEFQEGEHFYFATNMSIVQILSDLGVSAFWSESEIRPSEIARWLCKMAHGITVRHLGFDGWIPFALPYALTNVGYAPYIVGTRMMPVPRGDGLHMIDLLSVEHRGLEYYVVRLFLFTATADGELRPVYEVVTGRSTKHRIRGFLARLRPGWRRWLTRTARDPHLTGWPTDVARPGRA